MKRFDINDRLKDIKKEKKAILMAIDGIQTSKSERKRLFAKIQNLKEEEQKLLFKQKINQNIDKNKVENSNERNN